jgi:hypothetical protein
VREAELLAVARVSGAVLLIFGRQAGHPFRAQRGLLSRGVLPNVIITALTGVAGPAFILKAVMACTG